MKKALNLLTNSLAALKECQIHFKFRVIWQTRKNSSLFSVKDKNILPSNVKYSRKNVKPANPQNFKKLLRQEISCYH